MRIAVPNHPLAAPLLVHAQETCDSLGWKLLRMSDEECSDMLLSNRVDAALLTPVHYGLATGKVDLNIIPGPCVALHDYTNTMGVYFPNDVAVIKNIGAVAPQDFLSQMGAIVLRERFEAEENAVTTLSDSTQSSADCILAYPPAFDRPATLDVSEEFTDMAECPLPVYIWTCRLDADLEALPTAITSMADAQRTTEHVEEVVRIHDDHFTREGTIHYRWNDDIEEGLNAVFNLLFFHQVLPKLPEIKLLGSEQ